MDEWSTIHTQFWTLFYIKIIMYHIICAVLCRNLIPCIDDICFIQRVRKHNIDTKVSFPLVNNKIMLPFLGIKIVGILWLVVHFNRREFEF